MVRIRGWIRLTGTPVEIVAVGRLYSITQHYVPQLKGSAACMAPNECALCERNLPIQQLSAIPVRKRGEEDVWLLRLLPSQQSLASKLASQGNSLAGTIFQAELSAGNKLRRPLLAAIGREPVQTPPVDNYIKAIGRRYYELASEILLAQPELPEA